LETFLISTAIVAVAEMGDKTQLLSFVLAARLKQKVPIALGILFATLANHFVKVMHWIAAGLFVLMGVPTLFTSGKIV
jgi:Ca2+/H+ antiporter, TMEM165/GDT1 family